MKNMTTFTHDTWACFESLNIANTTVAVFILIMRDFIRLGTSFIQAR